MINGKAAAWAMAIASMHPSIYPPSDDAISWKKKSSSSKVSSVFAYK
jgi:hypothetical protein